MGMDSMGGYIHPLFVVVCVVYVLCVAPACADILDRHERRSDAGEWGIF